MARFVHANEEFDCAVSLFCTACSNLEEELSVWNLITRDTFFFFFLTIQVETGPKRDRQENAEGVVRRLKMAREATAGQSNERNKLKRNFCKDI